METDPFPKPTPPGEAQSSAAAAPSKSSTWKGAAKWGVRLVVLALVAWFGYRAFQQARSDFEGRQAELAAAIAELEGKIADTSLPPEERASLTQSVATLEAQRFGLDRIGYGWMFASAGLFALGMAPAWLVWRQSLREMGQPAPILPTLRAYYASQVGKYVPGKALVVVIRTALIRPFGVGIVPSVIASFVETLGLMAAGGAWSGALILIFASDSWPLALLAIGLTIGTGLPTLPPIFRRIVGFLMRKRPAEEVEPYLAGIDLRLFGESWALFSASWLTLGASMGCLLLAFPGPPDQFGEVLRLAPLLVATTALAMVAGFLSLLPGGVMVRELIVTTLLGAYVGDFKALCVAIAMRLVWLVTEFVVAGAFYALPLSGGRRLSSASASEIGPPESVGLDRT